MSQPCGAPSGYEILEELGRGTTGVVYRARDCRLGRLVALKCLLLDPRGDVGLQVARFTREARAIASLNGDTEIDIPSLHTVEEFQGAVYYTREFVEGSTLEHLTQQGSLTLRAGVAALVAVARTVARVHTHGFAHRNLHPANVLVTPHGTTKLIGFGRVGFLAGSDRLPPGEAGELPEVDVEALRSMLAWLCASCPPPVPNSLAAFASPLSTLSTPGAFADGLERILQAAW